MNVTFDIIWLGRGGQGAVTAANLLAEASIRSGKYALSIPFFGAWEIALLRRHILVLLNYTSMFLI